MNRLLRFATLTTGALAIAACGELTHPNTHMASLPAKGVAQESFVCTVTMAQRQLSCATTPGTRANRSVGGQIRADRIIGGQDIYVKLTSSGTSYDSGTEILSSDVTVQNLMQTLIGTTDGATTSGVSVFLESDPTVTSGSGSVTVANPDGTGVFTASNQPYFLYSEILEPYQISAAHNWQFSVPATVNTFEFTLYVSVPMVDPSAALVNAVWTGTTSTSWSDTANWRNGAGPADSSVIAIPRASLLTAGANQPALSANDTVSDLRVGEGSTLTLNGYQLTVTRNLDAPGTITGGTLQLTGDSARIGGNLPALQITGGARLQRATVTNAAVSITGSLSTQQLPFSIVIP